MKTDFNPWPLGIVAAFVVFIGGMATAVVIACTHSDSLVTRDYYEQELKFQNQIDGAVRARQAGASVRQAADGKVIIQLPVRQLAQQLAGQVELYRPSASELDQKLSLQPDARGVQTVDVSQMATGAWVIRVKWSAGGQGYFLQQKIKI
jgi:hypothetical protein